MYATLRVQNKMEHTCTTPNVADIQDGDTVAPLYKVTKLQF